ncbi:MAG TPA: hypothetical protein VJQ56_12710, partial [Blastocatellia bacterium]|nr:hypothetical protein [Blastocatellia bacterium]
VRFTTFCMVMLSSASKILLAICSPLSASSGARDYLFRSKISFDGPSLAYYFQPAQAPGFEN